MSSSEPDLMRLYIRECLMGLALGLETAIHQAE